MDNYCVHSEAEDGRHRKATAEQKVGAHSFALSYQGVFMPLQMVQEALQYSIRNCSDETVQKYREDTCFVAWDYVTVDVEEPFTPTKPKYRLSDRMELRSYGEEKVLKMAKEEQLRRVVIKGHCQVAPVGGVKVEAYCELYDHPESKIYGWERGAVTVTWAWLFSEVVETNHFVYENDDCHIWGVEYSTEMKPVPQSGVENLPPEEKPFNWHAYLRERWKEGEEARKVAKEKREASQLSTTTVDTSPPCDPE